MTDTMSSPRPRRTPLKPVTPLGQDLPEDTPSKVRLRSVVECAGIRRRQETESIKAELQVGLGLHEKLMQDRARKTEEAKADTTLRRQLFTRQKEHKLAAIQLETEQELAARELEAEERKVTQAWKDEKKRTLDAEKREERRMRAETIAHGKDIKAAEEARERQILAEEYASKMAERRREAEKEKAIKAQEMANRKAAILEAREKRARDRALAAAALRAEVAEKREVAIVAEENRLKAANEVRQSLRARAGRYREDKELLNTSAYAR